MPAAFGSSSSPGRTLAELEDVLLAVDDAQRPRRSQLAHVAGVEPAIVEHLRRLLLVLVVAAEQRGAPYHDLAPRRVCICAPPRTAHERSDNAIFAALKTPKS